MDHVLWYRTRVVDGLSDSHTSNMSIYLHQCLESFSYWWVSVCICSCIILSSDMHIEIILYISGTLLSLTDHGIKQVKSIQGEEKDLTSKIVKKKIQKRIMQLLWGLQSSHTFLLNFFLSFLSLLLIMVAIDHTSIFLPTWEFCSFHSQFLLSVRSYGASWRPLFCMPN